MPSSITLTVSHLPTSTSFFLSALQPLNYVYRGRRDNTIGFGSAIDPSAPADFWITQETPGVPAGAAHVAFNAPSRLAVHDFFTAALKAGGKFHGDPAVRDSSGYYSAAVIDFDGNSIEAVYRPTFSDDKENDLRSVVSNAKSTVTARSGAKSSFSRAPRTEVKSTTSRAVPQMQSSNTSQSMLSGDIIENLMAEARNAANVARQVVERARPSTNATPAGGSGETIMGTLLGVAAGAALHYAFTNNNNSDNNQRRPSAFARSTTEPAPTYYQSYRTIQATPMYHSSSPRSITLEDHEYASTIKPARSHHTRRNSGSFISTRLGSDHSSRTSHHGTIKMIECGSSATRSSRRSDVRMIEPPPPPSASTLVSTASSRRNGSVSDPLPAAAAYARSNHSAARSNHSVSTVVRVTEEAVHRAPSHAATSTAPKSRAPLSRASTTLREPEHYPLPPSRAGTWAGESMATSKAKSRSGESRHSKTSKSSSKSTARESVFEQEVTPDDSVSQISVRTGTTVRGSRR